MTSNGSSSRIIWLKKGSDSCEEVTAVHVDLVDRVKIPFSEEIAIKFSVTLRDCTVLCEDVSGQNLSEVDVSVPDIISISPMAFKAVSNWMMLHRNGPSCVNTCLSVRNKWRETHWGKADQMWAARIIHAGSDCAQSHCITWKEFFWTSKIYQAADYLGVDLLIDAFGIFLQYYSKIMGYSSLSEITKELPQSLNDDTVDQRDADLPCRHSITGRIQPIKLQQFFSFNNLNMLLLSPSVHTE